LLSNFQEHEQNDRKSDMTAMFFTLFRCAKEICSREIQWRKMLCYCRPKTSTTQRERTE